MIKETKKDLKKINRPFFFIGLFLIIGIAAGCYLSVNILLLYVLCSAFLVLSVLFINTRFFYLFFVILCIVMGILRYGAADIVADDNIANLIKSQKDIKIIGYIIKAPVFSKDRYGRERCGFNFKITHIINDHCLKIASGLVKVNSFSRLSKDFEYGYAYALEGDFKAVSSLEGARLEGYKIYLKNRYINGLFYNNKTDAAIKLDIKPKRNILYLWSMNLRAKLLDKYRQLLDEPYSGLLGALILGERAEIDKDFFISSGSVHVLAISGLHVGIIVLFLIFIGKIFGLNRTQASIICIGFLIFYCFLSGARVSVVRASIMAGIILGGWLIKRDSDIYNSLGLAAFLILMFNPYYLFDIGFQLSFISVLSIVYLFPKLNNLVPPLLKTNKFTKYFLDGLCVSLAASIAVAPLSLYYFQRVSTVGIFTNLIMLPLLSLVMILGVIVSLLSFISMPIAKIFAETLWLFLSFMMKTAQGFGNLPFSEIEFTNFKASYVLGCYLLLISIAHIDILSKRIKDKVLNSSIE